MQFKDKTVLITGANRGIGRALVETCLKRDAAKVYACARNPETLPDFEDSRVVPVKLDVLDNGLISAAAEKCTDTQILINNAGTLNGGTALGGDLEGFKKDMLVNCFGVVEVIRAFVPVLAKNPEARIVNIASIANYVNFPFIAGYSASKAALYSMSQAFRIELSSRNIPVHIVNPGAIDTDMNKGSAMEMTSPSDVAASIVAAVEAEIEDIIPDKIGRGMFEIWQRSPRELEELSRKIYFGG